MTDISELETRLKILLEKIDKDVSGWGNEFGKLMREAMPFAHNTRDLGVEESRSGTGRAELGAESLSRVGSLLKQILEEVLPGAPELRQEIKGKLSYEMVKAGLLPWPEPPTTEPATKASPSDVDAFPRKSYWQIALTTQSEWVEHMEREVRSLNNDLNDHLLWHSRMAFTTPPTQTFSQSAQASTPSGPAEPGCLHVVLKVHGGIWNIHQTAEPDSLRIECQCGASWSFERTLVPAVTPTASPDSSTSAKQDTPSSVQAVELVRSRYCGSVFSHESHRWLSAEFQCEGLRP